MADLDVKLKDDLKTFVEQEAARHGYASPAEYVSAVLEAFRQESHKSALEAELVRRIEGPEAFELPSSFWDNLKSRLRQPRATGGRA